MKKYLFPLFVALSLGAFAKKVKFAVDMSTYTISTLGIHVFGDFQAAAGYTLGNWQPNTTVMNQVGSTTIYTVVVDIPAFQKYEYKFINGDQSYEAEFVPEESRVGYGFNDNRWLYVDSLGNDTTFVGAIIFASNAPAGLKLVRYKVDMSNVTTISPKLPHVCGNFQSWDATKIPLYSFGANVYEIISYVTAGNYEYRFCNGNLLSTSEVVPAACVVNGSRGIGVPKDTVLATVCFASCSACDLTGIAENKTLSKGFKLFPNPATDHAFIEFTGENTSRMVYISDLSGRMIRSYNNVSSPLLLIEKGSLEQGVYFVSVSEPGTGAAVTKLIIE